MRRIRITASLFLTFLDSLLTPYRLMRSCSGVAPSPGSGFFLSFFAKADHSLVDLFFFHRLAEIRSGELIRSHLVEKIKHFLGLYSVDPDLRVYLFAEINDPCTVF